MCYPTQAMHCSVQVSNQVLLAHGRRGFIQQESTLASFKLHQTPASRPMANNISRSSVVCSVTLGNLRRTTITAGIAMLTDCMISLAELRSNAKRYLDLCLCLA